MRCIPAKAFAKHIATIATSTCDGLVNIGTTAKQIPSPAEAMKLKILTRGVLPKSR